MAETHFICALISKRAELSGEIARMETELAAKRADLLSIDNAIRIFDPTVKVSSIKAKLDRRQDRHFRRGELCGLLLDTLRDAGRAMTSTELAALAIEAKSLDAGNARIVKAMRSSVCQSLQSCGDRGVLVRDGDNGPQTMWRVA